MKGKITVLFGLVLMLAGLLWYASTRRDSACAAQVVREIAPQLRDAAISATVPVSEPTLENNADAQMKETVIDGIGYVGLLKIAALSLDLPVISCWSTENGKVAPCRYAGSVHQDNMIVCAHNYSSHFGKLNQLESGDTVIFTDIDGNEHIFQVEQFLTLDGTDVEKIRDGDWDLTLFTCTPGGTMRYCVRCGRVS